MPMTDIDQCRLMRLPRHVSDRGSLTEVQNDASFPFAVKRVFYIYDVPGGVERGGHAHRHDLECVIAVSGSFDIEITNGRDTKMFTLRRPYEALFVPSGLWLQMKNFSSGSICLVLDSDVYNEDDYIRDYADFLKFSTEDDRNQISVS